MASFAKLPVEILHGVCRYLARLSTESLRNLCLVNKAFNHLCSPLLIYRWRASQEYTEPPLEQFLLHLFRHPELRKKVKSLGIAYTLVPSNVWWLSDHPSPVDLDSETLSELAQAAASDVKMEPEHLEELCSDIKRGFSDALNVLLLTWCTNVVDLSIALPALNMVDGEESHVLNFATEAILRLLRDETPADDLPLGEVRHFQLHYLHDHDLYYEAATPFFHLPKIKSVMASGICDFAIEDKMWTGPCEFLHSTVRYEDYDMTEVPDAPSSLEEVELTNTGFAWEGLYWLLRVVRNLKKLTLQTLKESDDEPLNREEVTDSLKSCQDSLEELYLDTKPRGRVLDSDSRIIDDDLFVNSMVEERDTFQDFVKLRRLSCPMADIVSINSGDGHHIVPGRLPESIEYLKPRCLYLVEHWENRDLSVEPYIEAFIQILEEAGPDHRLCRLKVLDLSDVFLDDAKIPCISTMKDLADARGIELLLGNH